MKIRNYPLRHELKVQGHPFYCCSSFRSHSRVCDNESNSYPKINVKCADSRITNDTARYMSGQIELP